jgi:hypothetical protein
MTEEGSQEEGIGAAIGGRRICSSVEDDGFVGPYASCDHEVGEEASVGCAHVVGDVGDVGGGGH